MEQLDAVKKEEERRFLPFLPVSSLELGRRCGQDEELRSLYEEMRLYCVRYAKDVFKMALKRSEEGPDSVSAEEESARTRLHNATMDSIGILARQMSKNSLDASWAKDLTDRAKFGRFAIAFATDCGCELEELEPNRQNT